MGTHRQPQTSRRPALIPHDTQVEQPTVPLMQLMTRTPQSVVTLQRTLGNQTTRRLLHTNAPSLIQREVTEHKAINALKSLLESHGLEAKYQELWRSGDIRRIAKSVGDLADTDNDNLIKRLRAHGEIKPLLKNPRLSLESKAAPTHFDEADVNAVYNAYQRLVCYHYSPNAASVRESGLDPDFGGTDEGLSATRSLAGRREQNVQAAKKKVFISRKFTEAKQYAKGDDGNIVRLLVPTDIQQEMEVDSDSQFGVMGSTHLKGVVKADGYPNWWGFSYLMYEVDDDQINMNMPAIYKRLLDSGAIAKI